MWKQQCRISFLLLESVLAIAVLCGCFSSRRGEENLFQNWEELVSQSEKDDSGLAVTVLPEVITTETERLEITIDNQSGYDYTYCGNDILLIEQVDGAFRPLSTLDTTELAFSVCKGTSSQVFFPLEKATGSLLSEGIYRIVLTNAPGVYCEFTVAAE